MTPTSFALIAEFQDDRAGLPKVIERLVGAGLTLASLERLGTERGMTRFGIEVEGTRPPGGAEALLEDVPGLARVVETTSLAAIFGKRVIVIGGGAQVGQVAMGAVNEADRHNIRGERISVDTIPLVGEDAIADAVRAVAQLPRAAILVLAGSLMGGDVTRAVRELQGHGIPVIGLNMAGSVPSVADLVVSDPLQAGVMAVMAVADTARFDITRQRGRRY